MCVGRTQDDLCGGGNHDAHSLGLACVVVGVCVCVHDAHLLGADVLVFVCEHCAHQIGIGFMSNSEKH